MKKRKANLSLYDINVVGPSSLEISSGAEDREIGRWFDHMVEYYRAMADLDRVVMVVYDPDGDNYYLASVPENPND